MSILDDIQGAVFGAFLDDPDSFFRPGTIARVTMTGGGPYTQGAETLTETPCRVFINEYSAFMRGHLGIPDKTVNVLILQKNDAGNWVDVREGDTVTARGEEWRLTRVSQDPVRATWDCDGRPNG